MRNLLLASLLAGGPGLLQAAPPEPRPDLLRFENGDQLHGSFQGIKDGSLAVWERDDLSNPVEFNTSQVQKIILRGARPIKSTGSLSQVTLVNGDRLPGTLVGLDDESVTVATTFAGVLKVPRKLVGTVSPAPMGAKVRYYGPYSEDGWLMISTAHPDGIPAPGPAAEDAGDGQAAAAADAPQGADEPAADAAGMEEDAGGNENEEMEPGIIPRWDFSGAAWYWNEQRGTTGLVRKSGMEDRSILHFDLAWRNRLMLSVVFHSDFARPPKPADEDRAEDGDEGDDEAELEAKKAARAKRELLFRKGAGDPSGLAGLFGNCYVLQINAGYAMLQRCTLDEDGTPKMERLQMNNSGLRLLEMGSGSFELRCDRRKGVISLLVNGEQATEWLETGLDESPDGYAGKGGGFGFFPQADNAMIRVSDVVVADWNGNPDSARSMRSDEQDMVLLANGTDRFSGRITGFKDNKLRLSGKFGDFVFPLQEVAEVRFAENHLSEPPEMLDGTIVVRIDPLGRVSGRPLSGDSRKLRLDTFYSGEIEMDLDQAVILDFEPFTTYLDDWDQPF